MGKERRKKGGGGGVEMWGGGRRRARVTRAGRVREEGERLCLDARRAFGL